MDKVWIFSVSSTLFLVVHRPDFLLRNEVTRKSEIFIFLDVMILGMVNSLH